MFPSYPPDPAPGFISRSGWIQTAPGIPYRNGPTPSQLSSLSTCITRPNRTRRDLEVSWDSSVLDRRSDTPSPPRHSHSSRPNLVPAERLGQCSVEFCTRLRSLTANAISLYRLVTSNTKYPDELIQEINGKLKPRIVSLDEDILDIAHEIKYSVDFCTIHDHPLVYLLNYNAILDQIHSLLVKMMTDVFELLEQHLKRLDRGALGFTCQHREIQCALGRISESARQLEYRVREEIARSGTFSTDNAPSSTSSYR